MGYNFELIERLVLNKDFYQGKKIVSLGVLFPYVSSKEAKTLHKNYGVNTEMPREEFSKYLFEDVLNCDELIALDVDDYQGAELIADLNKPLVPSRKFDVVFDAGTLEHLCNVPMALNNIFTLLNEGGAYVFGAPCNGWVNHGFFQMSPTFYLDLCDGNNDQLLCSDITIHGKKNSVIVSSETKDIDIQMFVSSHSKITLSGVITKQQEGEISFDFIQGKYREWHSRDSNSVKKTKWLIRFVLFLLRSRFLPYQFKVLSLSALKQIKRLLGG